MGASQQETLLVMALEAVCLLLLALSNVHTGKTLYGGSEASGAPREGKQFGVVEDIDMGIKMLMMSVPGEPGVDYPILSRVPRTEFSCTGRQPDRFYSDPETGCQVHHKCSGGAAGRVFLKYSSLCPNGTLFDQVLQTCDWWYVVACPSETLGQAGAQTQVQAGAQAQVRAGAQTQTQSQTGVSLSGSSQSGTGISSTSPSLASSGAGGSLSNSGSSSGSSSTSSTFSTTFSSGIQNIPVLRPGRVEGRRR